MAHSERACARKTRHMTRTAAEQAIAHLRRAGKHRPEKGRLIAYRCGICGRWHHGHPDEPERLAAREAARLSTAPSIPEEHPPMTPQELSDDVERVLRRAQARVGPDPIGAQQYHVEGQPRRFETMALPALVDYAIEEALDHVNYGAMLTIRLDRLKVAAAMLEECLAAMKGDVLAGRLPEDWRDLLVAEIRRSSGPRLESAPVALVESWLGGEGR